MGYGSKIFRPFLQAQPGDGNSNSLHAQDQRDLPWSGCWIVDNTQATLPESPSLPFASARKWEGLLAGNLLIPIFIP